MGLSETAPLLSMEQLEAHSVLDFVGLLSLLFLLLLLLDGDLSFFYLLLLFLLRLTALLRVDFQGDLAVFVVAQRAQVLSLDELDLVVEVAEVTGCSSELDGEDLGRLGVVLTLTTVDLGLDSLEQTNLDSHLHSSRLLVLTIDNIRVVISQSHGLKRALRREKRFVKIGVFLKDAKKELEEIILQLRVRALPFHHSNEVEVELLVPVTLELLKLPILGVVGGIALGKGLLLLLELKLREHLGVDVSERHPRHAAVGGPRARAHQFAVRPLIGGVLPVDELESLFKLRLDLLLGGDGAVEPLRCKNMLESVSLVRFFFEHALDEFSERLGIVIHLSWLVRCVGLPELFSLTLV